MSSSSVPLSSLAMSGRSGNVPLSSLSSNRQNSDGGGNNIMGVALSLSGSEHLAGEATKDSTDANGSSSLLKGISSKDGLRVDQGGYYPPGSAAPGTNGTSSAAISNNRGYVYEYKGQKLEIRDVWRSNLEDEMRVIREVVRKYPYVAMDTEFPGVVARPIGSFHDSVDYSYQTLRCNVDLLKLIQLGVAFADQDGNFASGCPCWQFHFKFSLTDDMYAQDSIDLLVRSGINFKMHATEGIDVMDFGELLISSGLVLCDEVRWISFHGSYDFGYLLKLLTCMPLPADEASFFDLMKQYFPRLYDVKHIMSKVDGGSFKGGLNKLAEELKAQRIGPEHQAGSDSLLTASTFFEVFKQHFNRQFDDEAIVGMIYGLGQSEGEIRTRPGQNVVNPNPFSIPNGGNPSSYY